MKAQRLVGYAPLTMEVEGFELDEALPAGHMLLEAGTTTISAGTEIANYRGTTLQHSADNKDWRNNPYYPGYSFTGTVLAVGPGVTEFRVGDRVAGQQRHQSHAVVDANEFVKIPEGVSFDHAAMTTLVCIVMNAVRLARPELGDRVAVVGAGLIGQLALRLNRLVGARPVVSFDPIEKRRALAHDGGSDFEVDPFAEDKVEQIERALHGANRFDIVYEATGSPAPFNDAVKLVNYGGKFILLGSTRGLVTDFDPYADVHLNGVTIIGVHMSTHPAYETQYNRWTWKNNRILSLKLIQNGDLDLDPLISHRVPAFEGPAMFQRLHEAREDFYGVLLNWKE